MNRPSRLLLALALPLALVGCKRTGGRQDLDSLDKELTDANGAGRDPALTASLRDQITVDPTLTQSSNIKAVRPPSQPDPHAVPPDQLGSPADTSGSTLLRTAPPPSGSCPGCTAHRQSVTLGALAERGAERDAERGGERNVSACASDIHYASSWALRLPAALPLYPDARVSEAAGKDGGGCTLRVVSFASNAAPARLIDWYYTHATKGGYSAQHQADGADHVLTGVRGDAAYVVYVSPRPGGGTSVDVVSNGG